MTRVASWEAGIGDVRQGVNTAAPFFSEKKRREAWAACATMPPPAPKKEQVARGMGHLRGHPSPAMPASMPCARLDTHPPPDQLGYRASLAARWAPLWPGADPRAPAVTIVAATTTPGLGRALRFDALKGSVPAAHGFADGTPRIPVCGAQDDAQLWCA